MRLMFAVVLLSTITFAQQSKNPVTDVLRDTLEGRQKNTVAAIEEMPADKFSAKPTPDQMSFAHLAAHIADANYFFCAKVGDVADPKAEKVTEADSKDKLVAAVKASCMDRRTSTGATTIVGTTWCVRSGTPQWTGMECSPCGC